MRKTTAALKKEIRIMRTPEDAGKLSQQVSWNKKIHSDAQSQTWLERAYKEHGYRLHEIAALLGMHYAMVSRHLKREQNGNA